MLSVRLVHENGSIELKHLGPGKSRQARFVAAGESSYKIDAVLADGRSIQGGEAYVESGYHLTAVINELGIESKHGSLY